MAQTPDYNLFPTLIQVKKGIKALDGYQWPKYRIQDDIDAHIDKITKKLGEYFNILPDLLYIHGEKHPLPFNFFRARPLDTFQDTSMLCEYSYKPIHLTNEIQRCNFPSKPVFYASNDAATALMELIKNQPFDKERKYLVSKWVISNEYNTKILPYLYAELPEKNYYKLFGKRALENMPIELLENLNDDQIKGLKLYFNYLASKFTSENYSLSASLVHRILYANHNFRADLFLYPSVQTSKESINIAVHPNYVDTNMKLKRIYSLHVNRMNQNNGEVNISIDRYADIEGSIIMWKKINPNDENYTRSIKEDFQTIGEFTYNP